MKNLRILSAIGISVLVVTNGAWAQETTGSSKPAHSKRVRHKLTQAAIAPTNPTPFEPPHPAKEKPAEVKFEFNAYGGFCSFLSQNEKSLWGGGYTAGFWGGYFLDPRALVGIRMEYMLSNGNPVSFAQQYLPSSDLSASFGTNGPDLNMICIVPSFKMNLNLSDDSPVKPYFLFGAGIMNKSVAQGMVSGVNGAGSSGSVTITGYSTTVPMISFALGLPIQLPDGFKVPVEMETGVGFTPDQNTDFLSLTAGISRDW